jgi:hypothetical protein
LFVNSYSRGAASEPTLLRSKEIARMKISELSDDERREYLDKAYQTACDLCGSGDLEAHPSRTIMDWVRAGRARDKARDEGGLGPVEIENKRKPGNDDLLDDPNSMDDDPDAIDNPPDFEGKPANPTLRKPAQDGRYSTGTDGVPRFERVNAKGETVSVVVGDAALVVRAAASSPAKVRAMGAALKNYHRLK